MRTLYWDGTTFTWSILNRILDYMIVDDPEKRRGIENITILTQFARRLVEKEYTPMTAKHHYHISGQGLLIDY